MADYTPSSGFTSITTPDGRTLQLPDQVAAQVLPQPQVPILPVMAPPQPVAAPPVDEPALAPENVPIEPAAPVSNPAFEAEWQAAAEQNIEDAKARSGQLAPGQSYRSSTSFRGVPPGAVGPSKFQKVDPSAALTEYELIQGNINQGMRQKAAGLGEEKVAQQAVNEVEADYGQQIADKQAFEAARMGMNNDYIAKQLAAEEQRIEAARAAVPQMQPNRIFQNMNLFDRAMFVLSAGIAGALSVKQGGGQNQVIQTAMQLMDADMQAQKVNIETAREDVYRAERAYERLGQRLQADENARREMAIYKIEALKSAMAAEKMKFASVFTQAKYDQAIGELTVQQQNYMKGILDSKTAELRAAVQLNNDAEYKKQSIALQRAQVDIQRQEAAARRAEAEAKKNAVEMKRHLTLGKSTGFQHADGRRLEINLGDEVVDREQFGKLQTAGLAATKAAKYLQRLQHMDFSHFQALSPDEKAKIASAGNALVMSYGEISGEKLGRLTEADANRYEKALTATDVDANVRLQSEKAIFEHLKQSYDDLGAAQQRLGQSLGDGYEDVVWAYPPAELDGDSDAAAANRTFGQLGEGTGAVDVVERLKTSHYTDKVSTDAQTEQIAAEVSRLKDRTASGDIDPGVAAEAAQALYKEAEATRKSNPEYSMFVYHQAWNLSRAIDSGKKAREERYQAVDKAKEQAKKAGPAGGRIPGLF